MGKRVLCFFVVWFSVVAISRAENLVVNPDFDTDLSGWDAHGVWDPMDVNGSPTSGSATFVFSDPGSGGYCYMFQCIELTTGFGGYVLSGWVYVPSGQPTTGTADMVAWIFSDTECSVHIGGTGTRFSPDFDVWQFQTVTEWLPAGAASVGLCLFNSKEGGGDHQTYHDAIFFGPNPTMVFADGFETGDTSLWSVVFE